MKPYPEKGCAADSCCTCKDGQSDLPFWNLFSEYPVQNSKKSAARRSTPTRTAVIFFSFIAPLLSIYIPYRTQFLYKYELHPQFFPEDGSWSQSEYDRQ